MDFRKLQDMAISELSQYKKLAASGDPADRSRAAAIYDAMHLLEDRERDILEQFYTKRERRYAGHRARLQAKYQISRERLYREKYAAVMKYCVCMLAAKLAAKDKARST